MFELRPILVVLINFVAGGLVTHGVLDPINSNQFAQEADTIIGSAILLITSLISLWRLVHKHPAILPVVDTTQKQVTVTETVSAPVKTSPVEILPVPDGGTPPAVQ